MNDEEARTLPFYPADIRATILRDHNRWRMQIEAGQDIDLNDIKAHAVLEDETNAQIGLTVSHTKSSCGCGRK
jgi:hypothetical protein